jgi:hypothetical protein
MGKITETKSNYLINYRSDPDLTRKMSKGNHSFVYAQLHYSSSKQESNMKEKKPRKTHKKPLKRIKKILRIGFGSPFPKIIIIIIISFVSSLLRGFIFFCFFHRLFAFQFECETTVLFDEPHQQCFKRTK